MGLLDGVLGTSMDDPRTAGILALAGGMVRGDFGGGLLNAGTAMQSAQDSLLKRQDLAQQMQLRNLQLQQAQQEWQIQQPLLAAAVARLRGGQAPQAASAAQPASAPSQPAIAPTAGGTLGSGTFGIATGGQPASAAPVAAPSQSQGAGGTLLPGVPDDVAMWNIGAGGIKAIPALLNEYNKPTDFQKLLSAAGIDPRSPIGQAAVLQQIKKQNNIPLQSARAGAPMVDSEGNIVMMAPKIPDNAVPQIVNGQVVGVSPLSGAAQVQQINAYAQRAGQNQAEPMTAYSGTQPVFTNKLTAAQAGGITPAMADAQSTPQQRAAGDVQSLQREIAMAQASNDPPQAKQARLAILNSELSKAQAQLTPGLAPGVAESQSALATANAGRYNKTIDQASDGGTRLNVYDNILNLSKQGIATGPGQEWINAVKGFAANTPLVKNFTGDWKDDVSGFQELNKFMYQNAQRSWQAAGGTGTDSQLEAFTRANPNSKMFPQALQAMAQWGKAGELALQGKTNAMQAWKDQNGGNVANLDGFERAWRNNFDPILFQLKTMDPQQQAAYVQNLKTTNPSAYGTLMMKAGALKNLGGL